MNAYHMQAQSSLFNMLTHLIFTATSWCRFRYESYFTDDEIEAESLDNSKRQSWHLDPSSLAPESVSLTTTLSCSFWNHISIIFRRKLTLQFVEKAFHIPVLESLLWFSVCEWVSVSGTLGKKTGSEILP